MAVVERYFWEPNDLEEFLSLHREIYDQHLRKAGASDMTLWQDRSNWRLYVAEVWFENFAALGPVIKYTLDRLGDIVLLGGKTLFPFPMEEKSHDDQTLRSP